MDKESLIKAAIADPYAFFFNFRQHALRDDIQEVLKQLAEQIPQAVIAAQPKYKNQPYANTVIQIAADKILKSGDAAGLGTLLSASQDFADRTFAATLVDQVAHQAFERGYYYVILKYASVYEAQPWAADMIQKSAQMAGPEAVLQAADILSNTSYGPALLAKAARDASPDTRMEYHEIVNALPDGAALMEDAVRKCTYPLAHPVALIQPYAKEIVPASLERTLENRPGAIINEGERLDRLLKGQPANPAAEEKARGKAKKDDTFSAAQPWIEKAAAKLGPKQFSDYIYAMTHGFYQVHSDAYINMLSGVLSNLHKEQQAQMSQQFLTTLEGMLPEIKAQSLTNRIGDGDENISLDEIRKTFQQNNISLRELDIDKDDQISPKEILQTITNLDPVKPKGNQR